jgi:misacylated tRNA(Ala) deacylase
VPDVTELLYQTDSYLRSAEAEIVDILDQGVVLDRTPFYPSGGGQPADAGRFVLADGTERVVTSMKRHEGIVCHVLEDASGLARRDRVQAVIDWDRRYALMRTHTALHILCGVIWRDWQVPVTGGNMEPLRGRLDFELPHLGADFVGLVERKVNVEIETARPIEVAILSREAAFRIPDLIRTKINLLPEGIEEVRTVNIVGLDLQADGGTHVANTKEVGSIRIADYKSKGKGNKRIVIEVGEAPG